MFRPSPLARLLAILSVLSTAAILTLPSPKALAQDPGPRGEGGRLLPITVPANKISGPANEGPLQMTAAQRALFERYNERFFAVPEPPQAAPSPLDASALAPMSRVLQPVASPPEAGPKTPKTEVPQSTVGPLSPGDFTVNRSTSIQSVANAGGSNSTTNEPSLAQKGQTVFYTGNWYAARSADGGQTFSYVNPFTLFPSAAGGFCCDQVTIYEPSRDIFIWLLQYNNNGSGNIQRIAIANGESDVASNSWHYYDFSAQSLGYAAGVWLDYPHMGVSNNYFYWSTNAFDQSDMYVGSILVRLSLDQLRNNAALSGINTYTTSFSTFTPVGKAGATMYWARRGSTASDIRVFTWPESVAAASVTFTDVSHQTAPGSARVCTTPDGRNPCNRVDGRINTAWLSGNTLGFAWTASQGSIGGNTFPYPFVFVVRLDASTKAVVDQPHIWFNSAAGIYPSATANADGGVGVTFLLAGASNYPSSILGLRDGISGSSWELYSLRAGTDSPGTNRMGDYTTVRLTDGVGPSYVGASYTLQGPCTSTASSNCPNVEPRYYQFGRAGGTAGPPNDLFASPTSITGTLPQTRTQSTVGATVEGETMSCRTPYATVWFTWTPSTSGSATVHTIGSSFDTTLAAYSGTSLGSLTELACNDDANGTAQSSITFNVTAGVTYRILAGGFAGATGDLTLTVASVTGAADPRQEGPVQIAGSLQVGGRATFTINVRNYGGAATQAIHPYIEGTNTANQFWRADGAAPGSAVIQPGQTQSFTVYQDLGAAGMWTSNGVFLWDNSASTYWKPLPANGQNQQFSFQVQAAPQPVQVQNLRAAPLSSTSVRLQWDYAGAPVTGFRVVRYVNNAWQWGPTVDASARSFDDTNLQPGTTYTYTIDTLSTGGQVSGCGAPCLSVSVTTFGRVGVSLSRAPGPSLVALLTARTGCGPIASLDFGLGANTVLTITTPAGGPSGRRQSFTYTPPVGTTFVSLRIERIVPSGGAMVNIRLYDNCGVWPTFVGGGNGAF